MEIGSRRKPAFLLLPQGQSVNPLYVLATVILLGHAVQVGARLAVMLYAVHLDASPAVIGIITALFTLVSMFTSVPVGRWIDRSGSRTPMLLGSAMLVLGAAIGFVWRDLAALFAVSVIIGSFYNMVFIAQQRLAGQYGKPEDRVRNFSITSLCQSVGGMIGPIIAGVALEQAGYPETFLLFAGIAAIPLLGLASGLLKYPPHEPARARADEARAGTFAMLREDPDLRRVYAVSVLTSSTWSILMFLLPLYGIQIGLGASAIGFIIGSFSIATVAIRIALPWLSRRFSHWQMILGSLVCSGIGFMALPGTTSVALLTVIAAWIGFGLGLCGPTSQAILYDASPAGRIGELLGTRVMLLNGSHAAMPVLTGAIGTATGVGPVFWVVAGCLMIGSWMIRAQWRRAGD
jgi:MFS family permease